MATLKTGTLSVQNTGLVMICGGFQTDVAGDIVAGSVTPEEGFSFSVVRDGINPNNYEITLNKEFRQILSVRCAIFAALDYVGATAYGPLSTQSFFLQAHTPPGLAQVTPVSATMRFMACCRETGGPF